jgi:8-oxo-dGTP pyrophosphatase MutT (NUDIX family)
MYRIYVNERLLRIGRREEFSTFSATDKDLIIPYYGPKRLFFNYLDQLEQSKGELASITVFGADPDQIRNELFSLLVAIPAAGGVVFNPEGRILTLYRRGWWDLPKGKIDPGETIQAAALREVQEETGLQQVELGPFIGETYHLYRLKDGRRAIKWSYWYRMESEQEVLVPQQEEDIEQAIWLAPEELQEKTPLYANIKDLLRQLEVAGYTI